MKKILAVLLIAVALAGCRTRYDITMTSGMKVTGVSKPKFDAQRSHYVFQDDSGRIHSVPSSRVRVIEPTGSSAETNFGETKLRRAK